VLNAVQELDEYELWFDAYTPETIPMERLAEYLLALSKLLGNQANVHFSKLKTGSTSATALVEREAAPKVAQRLAATTTSEAANDAIAAINTINRLLQLDNAVGQLRHTNPTGQTATVIKFPGRELPTPEKFGPFKEPATFDGELVRIGGKDSTAHALIVDVEGVSWPVEMSREVAQRVAPHLYKGPVLRVEGEARWERTEEGRWKLLSFKLEEFKVLEPDELLAVTERLRSLRDSNWASNPDMDSTISRLRGHEDGLH
jgi:hypothetical protein